MEFLAFLDTKPLYYDVIDLYRMPRAWRLIQHRLKLPRIVHLIGTNGKGTTGRFLASALQRAGYRVGHYTSPHILRFNERMWLNGADADDAMLQSAFETLLSWLDPETAEALSYFEFTTLMAVVLFEPCDYIVMEAGLGGEYDATAVFEKQLTLVTPIGLDHQAFLGDTVGQIATTKLNAMAPLSILGAQPFEEVYAIASRIAAHKRVDLRRVEAVLDENGIITVQKVTERLGIPEYLRDNLTLAVAAMMVLEIRFSDVWFDAPLFGRMSRIDANVWLDVGHNVMAAEAIAATLGSRKVTLIYNSYGDKDYEAILTKLRPNLEGVELITVTSERAAPQAKLKAALESLQIPYSLFKQTLPEREYLVFGSFSVAEAFLKWRDAHQGVK